MHSKHMFISSNRFCSLKFTDAFAFGAEHLISHHVTVWMLQYADQVIVGGQPSKDAIGNLLYSSGIGKHTSVVYINKPENDPLTVHQYFWEHNTQRPNGFTFPLACPLCKFVHSWSKVPGFIAESGSSVSLKCKSMVKGKVCGGSWMIAERPSSEKVKSPYVGTWRKC